MSGGTEGGVRILIVHRNDGDDDDDDDDDPLNNKNNGRTTDQAWSYEPNHPSIVARRIVLGKGGHATKWNAPRRFLDYGGGCDNGCSGHIGGSLQFQVVVLYIRGPTTGMGGGSDGKNDSGTIAVFGSAIPTNSAQQSLYREISSSGGRILFRVTNRGGEAIVSPDSL